MSAMVEPYTDEHAVNLINRAAGGETIIFEWLNRRKNGDLFYSENILKSVVIAGKRRVMAIVRDIRDRKIAEDALRESEERYRHVSEYAPVGIFQFKLSPDGNGTFVFVSQGSIPILGIPVEPILHDWKLIFDRINPSHRKTFEEGIQLSASELTLFNETFLFLSDVHGEIWVEVKSAPRRLDDGSILWTGVFIDVDKIKRTESALRESETLKSHIIEAIPDIIFILDGKGTYCDVMTSDEGLLLVPKTDLISKNLIDIIPGEEGRKMTEAITQTLKSQNLVIIEYTLPVPAGICHFEARIVPYSEEHVLALIRNITEKKNAEEALRTANKKLNLLSSITRHDIRNKINSLQVYLDLTRSKVNELTLSSYLDGIAKAATSIHEQIEFTKVYENLGVRTPVWQQISVIISTIDDSQLPIRKECNDISIYADPMFEKVLHNLYDNIVRHAERADTATIRCEELDGYLVLTLEDNGTGVPDHMKEQIFEKGFGNNTGFGLFLAREVLAITGISIRENGVYGEGARFEIQMPAGAWMRGEK